MSKIGIQTHGVNHKIMRKGLKTGGRAAKFGGGRTDLLEELGRVEGERSNPNRRAEISRVHSELNKGYKDGGRTGFRHGKYVRTPVPHADISKYMFKKKEESPRERDELSTMKIKPKKKKLSGPRAGRPAAAEGGRIGFKKGTDKNWMQKVNKSIKKRGTKGKCTPITKPGCTGRAKALAKTFKKIAAKNKKA